MSSADYEGDSSYSRTSSNLRSRGNRGASTWNGTKEAGSSTGEGAHMDEYPSYEMSSTDYNPMRELQRKQNHNEAEKKRVRNINKCVEDLKVILDNANISHKSDKVSTLETAVSYMRELMKERDRLNTNLGYISSLVSTGVSDEEVESDEDDIHFLSRNVDASTLPTTGIMMEDDHPCIVQQMGSKNVPCDPKEVSARMIEEAEKVSSRKCGIDYKSIWMNNSLPCMVAQINSGKLLKGNTFFMKLFGYESMEELNKLSFFDIISPNDLSIFWSEYSQLVNSQHQTARSFVCVIKNPSKAIQFPCLLTLGSIMDYEGHVFQVAATFTPLKQVNEEKSPQPETAVQAPPPVNVGKFL